VINVSTSKHLEDFPVSSLGEEPRRVKIKKTLLIYPPLGSDDVFIKDVPLSVVYLAAESVKEGYTIEILDLRLYPDWKKELKSHLTEDVMLAGISVMTGNPIKNAIAITHFIKANSSAKVVWGGHHPTMEYESTMRLDKIDFVIRGPGSNPLKRLIGELLKDKPDFANVPSLSYRQDGRVVHNPQSKGWEKIPFKDIPYFLIEKEIDKYNRFGKDERIMPIFTSMGCPYKCSFCMAPILYRDREKKWIAFDIEEIVEHIKFLKEKYNVTYLSVYDDDSFIDIERMRRILERLVEEGIKLKIDFRGARVNELDRMSDEFLELLVRAGVSHFQVGLESGSQKVLDIMHKKINYDQIIRVNRRLARYNLTPIYNLMVGVPGETIEDVKLTRDLVLKLYEENKHCITGFPAKFKPLPGTVLYDEAIRQGLKPVDTLEGWISMDTGESDMFFPWYTKEYNAYLNMFQIVSYFIDNKILREIPPTTLFNRLLRILATIYRPIALLRLKYDITSFNIEYLAYRLFRRLARKEL
jgi:radical SAM superfamily enzyme YgiQ (UPF0313 family)